MPSAVPRVKGGALRAWSSASGSQLGPGQEAGQRRRGGARPGRPPGTRRHQQGAGPHALVSSDPGQGRPGRPRAPPRPPASHPRVHLPPPLLRGPVASLGHTAPYPRCTREPLQSCQGARAPRGRLLPEDTRRPSELSGWQQACRRPPRGRPGPTQAASKAASSPWPSRSSEGEPWLRGQGARAGKHLQLCGALLS